MNSKLEKIIQTAYNSAASPGPPPSNAVKSKAIKVDKSETQSNRKMDQKVGKQQIKIR